MEHFCCNRNITVQNGTPESDLDRPLGEIDALAAGARSESSFAQLPRKREKCSKRPLECISCVGQFRFRHDRGGGYEGRKSPPSFGEELAGRPQWASGGGYRVDGLVGCRKRISAWVAPKTVHGSSSADFSIRLMYFSGRYFWLSQAVN